MPIWHIKAKNYRKSWFKSIYLKLKLRIIPKVITDNIFFTRIITNMKVPTSILLVFIICLVNSSWVHKYSQDELNQNL